jgi:hypothetical protein
MRTKLSGALPGSNYAGDGDGERDGDGKGDERGDGDIL